MRVIGGEFRSRVLKSLPGLDVRPTPDRLREALFNILTPRIQGVVFADIYAGTGAVGIEAISRGARKAIFIENNRAAAGIIRENIRALNCTDRAEIHQSRAADFLARLNAQIVFLDPPYRLEKEYERSLSILGENPPELTIVQHTPRLELASDYGKLTRVRVLRQGDNVLSFYEPNQ